MPVISQQTEAADYLGVTPRTLRDWSNQPGFPDSAKGYDTEAIEAWREREQRKGSTEDQTAKKLKLALTAERLKQAQIQTRRDQLELEKREGTLLPRKGVEESMAVILSSLVDWTEQLPDLIAAIVPADTQAKVRDRLRTELEERRVQLAGELRSLAAGGDAS
jgi:hypothetical protein